MDDVDKPRPKKNKLHSHGSKARRAAARAALRAAQEHLEADDQEETAQHVQHVALLVDATETQQQLPPSPPLPQPHQQQHHHSRQNSLSDVAQPQQHDPLKPRLLLPLFTEAFMRQPPLGPRNRSAFDRILPGELPYSAGNGYAVVFPLGDYTHFGPFGSPHRMHVLDNLVAVCIVECAPFLRAVQWLPSAAERHQQRSRLQLFFPSSTGPDIASASDSLYFRILCSGLVVPTEIPGSMDATTMNPKGIFTGSPHPLPSSPLSLSPSPPQMLKAVWRWHWSLRSSLPMCWTLHAWSSSSVASTLLSNVRGSLQPS